MFPRQGSEVGCLFAARGTFGVPKVQDDDVTAPVGYVDWIAGHRLSGKFDRLTPFVRVPHLDRAITTNISGVRSEEHTSELQSRFDLVCRLPLEKKKKTNKSDPPSSLER